MSPHPHFIGQCRPPDPNISGLAWNPAFGIVGEATNSPTDTIYELNPDTCAVLNTLPHPTPGFNGAGLEMDAEGNLWMIRQSPNNVHLVDSGVPAFVDVPWLSESPSSGTLDPGGTEVVMLTLDTAGLAPGVYNASLFLQTNAARRPSIRISVNLVVPAYQVAANSGGAAYTDSLGDPWEADQAYAAGSWGYMNARSRAKSTSNGIAGTIDDRLYQDLREDPLEYRFDVLPPGVYQVELLFAEILPVAPGKHMYDVILEYALVLPAHDTALEVGTLTADRHGREQRQR